MSRVVPDGQSIADVEADLSNNLYKLWKRLASGSYFPPPVRRVDIPKDDGRTRPLGISTVADRVAQMVGKRMQNPFPLPNLQSLFRSSLGSIHLRVPGSGLRRV
jgi:retron-type reverse transcriptase